MPIEQELCCSILIEAIMFVCRIFNADMIEQMFWKQSTKTS